MAKPATKRRSTRSKKQPKDPPPETPTPEPSKQPIPFVPIPRPTTRTLAIASIVVDTKIRSPLTDSASFQELRESIREKRLLSPIGVNQLSPGGGFELIFGARRLAACRELHYKRIKAHVYPNLDAYQIYDLRYVENVHRENLNPIEEAEELHRRLDKISLEGLACALGKSRQYVSFQIDLLRLDKRIKPFVASGRIPVPQAHIIARLGNPTDQLAAAQDTVGYAYSGKNLAETAAASDYVLPTRKLREIITYKMQAMGSAGWPLDKRYAGKRPCTGCPNNTTTTPTLFEGFKCPGTSKKGNCTFQECYRAKSLAWEKDPVKKARDKAKAEKAKGQKAPKKSTTKLDLAGGVRGASREDSKISAARKAFPGTPDQRYAVACWHYGNTLLEQLCTFLSKKTPKQPTKGAEAEVLSLLLCTDKLYIDLPKLLDAKDVAHTFAAGMPVRVYGTTLAKLLERMYENFFHHCEPTWDGYRPQPANVPLVEEDWHCILAMEALVERWGITPKTPRPRLEIKHEGQAGPAPTIDAVIITGKKAKALKALEACTDLQQLKSAMRSPSVPIHGDWRRAAMWKRIRELETQALKGNPQKPKKAKKAKKAKKPAPMETIPMANLCDLHGGAKKAKKAKKAKTRRKKGSIGRRVPSILRA